MRQQPFSRMQHRRRPASLALRVLAVLAMATALQCVGMSLRSAGRLEAQQPQDNVVATTLFETAFDAPPPGPATVTAATIALAPGQASLTLEGPGTLLILVQSGTVTLLSDQAIAGLASVDDGDEDGGLGNTYHLRTGQRVTLP